MPSTVHHGLLVHKNVFEPNQAALCDWLVVELEHAAICENEDQFQLTFLDSFLASNSWWRLCNYYISGTFCFLLFGPWRYFAESDPI